MGTSGRPGALRIPAVIAQLGVNHDGSLARAVALIEMAVSCGVQAVCLPVYQAGLCMPDPWSATPGPLPALDLDSETVRACELGAPAIRHCIALARSRRIDIGLHACDPVSLVLSQELGPDFLVLDLQNGQADTLLELALETRIPLVVQLGEADTGDLDQLRQHLGAHAGRTLVMHGALPAPLDEGSASPDRVSMLERWFERCGFCDHTGSLACALAATHAGAQAISVHITLDRAAPGPCHHWGLDRTMLSSYVATLRRKPATIHSIPALRPVGSHWWEQSDDRREGTGNARA
ncbi:MAG: N-acetylneuraminate synthase family protein [Calditrichaeota bacterium]|nr:N-acetylneuraminate synthase family protein [Calditrichota bacterium]MCB9472845.1 N-acetylneuraminate synthase family protein [Candidatus Delongbacteria bacterium]